MTPEEKVAQENSGLSPEEWTVFNLINDWSQGWKTPKLSNQRWNNLNDRIVAAIRAAVEEEREACAAILDNHAAALFSISPEGYSEELDLLKVLADEIRARSQGQDKEAV